MDKVNPLFIFTGACACFYTATSYAEKLFSDKQDSSLKSAWQLISGCVYLFVGIYLARFALSLI